MVIWSYYPFVTIKHPYVLINVKDVNNAYRTVIVVIITHIMITQKFAYRI